MPDFRKPPKKNESVYDLEFDRVLIEQSIAKQYGILPSAQEDLPYTDWAKLVGGLMEDTPLGQVVAIRREKDYSVIRRFSPEQRRIRADWAAFKLRHAAPAITASQRQQLDIMQRAFADAYGKEEKV